MGSKKAKSIKTVDGELGKDVRVVFIHGIGDQGPKDALHRAWNVALFGDPDAPSEMAYWSDILHPQPEAGAAQRTRRLQPDSFASAGALAKGAVGPDALPDNLQSNKKAVKWAESMGRHLAENPVHSTGLDAGHYRSMRVSGKIVPLPAWARRPITKVLVGALIKDTAAYLFDAKLKERMRDRLRSVLRKDSRPVVLVSHSQGTIISYDVLVELGAALEVRKWITLGSPLGIREVQDFLIDPKCNKPVSVQAWHNFADPLDVVAGDKWLASDFKPKDFVKDHVVLNRNTRLGSGFNPHSSLGYLQVQAVRNSVLESLPRRGDILNYGSLIRKDVLSAFGDRGERVEVLIEIRDEDAWPSASTTHQAGAQSSLDMHRELLVQKIEQVIADQSGKDAIVAASIDPLRRYVAASLTPAEIELLAAAGRKDLWTVWANNHKRKLSTPGYKAVHADAAHATFGASGKGIVWAVLDTGVDAKHDHFSTFGNIREVWDCTRPGKPQVMKSAKDPDGHGTHVAGIIGGVDKARSPKVTGIAPQVELVVYKVLDDSGGGKDAWIIKALDHIASRNEAAAQLYIHGVNLSLGGWFDPSVYGCGHSPICQELRRLWRQGAVVCVAAGNEGQVNVVTPANDDGLESSVVINSPMSIGDPANLEECIAVGSVNAMKPHLYGVSFFSSRGPTADGRAKPDLVAPGESIRSAATGGDYVEASGTSMACPHVSGMIAAFLSARREFIGRPDEVKQRLLASCEDLGRDRYHQGAGLPSLVRMLAST